jgi:diacylglycerol kinase (ATP)
MSVMSEISPQVNFMAGKKCTIILNPFAKAEKAGHLWYQLYKVSRRAKIKLTKERGSATRKAYKTAVKGGRTVVAAGGDGTMNEVLNGIMGTDAVMGLLPIGSVNVLARELKIPMTIEAAWKVIEAGYHLPFDVVRVTYREQDRKTERYFVQLAGVGLDAHIVQHVTWRNKLKFGPLSYVFESLRSIRHKMPKLSVSVDGGAPRTCSFVLIGNGSYYGGSIPVFNKASMMDGLMDICTFESAKYLDLIAYLYAVLSGTHHSAEGIVYTHGRTLEVTAEEPVPVELDGEFVGHTPSTFEIFPRGVRILVPREAWEKQMEAGLPINQKENPAGLAPGGV